MTQFYQFKTCGCQFPIENKHIDFWPEVQNINLECPLTWQYIQSGNTKGMFQIESQLGKKIAEQLKPSTIEELSALIAIMRPGASEALLEDGKSITEHYILRKNKEEEVTYYNPALESILEDTYGLLVYQEQSIEIGIKLAGFSPEEADILRKSIGKKKPEEMSKIKQIFVDGCKKQAIINE